MSSSTVPASPDLSWFLHARFGISFHWGVASVPGRGDGWLRSYERIPLADYEKFFAGFRPSADWAPRWAEAVKDSGAGYAFLTAKHHDGFCLWPSAHTDYHVDRTAARGRDLVREFIDATRAAGLRVGLYYSLVDWRHPDFPHHGDRQHPLRFDPAAEAAESGRDFSRYLEFMHAQVRDLMTNYGRIDILVVDFAYWHMKGETWRARELVTMIRELQPHIIINDRFEIDSVKQSPPPPWAGDFDSTELDVPRERLRSADGRVLPFDAWYTLGQRWFHDEADALNVPYRKTARTLLRSLVNCVSKHGVLALNLAPDPTGALHPHDLATLRTMGTWLRQNGESVFGAGPADLPKPEWGRWTQKGDTLYAHITEPGIGHYSLPALRGQVKRARVLATGRDGLIGNYWNIGVQTFDALDDLFFNFAPPMGDTHPLPDEIDTVIALDLATTDAERAALLAPLEAERERACHQRIPNP